MRLVMSRGVNDRLREIGEMGRGKGRKGGGTVQATNCSFNPGDLARSLDQRRERTQ
jgi:hypothetical protein